MMRRTEEGAVKCALRDFRLEEDTALESFIMTIGDGSTSGVLGKRWQ